VFATLIFTLGRVLSPICRRKLTVGDWPLGTKKNLVGGHEGAGVVVEVGSAVTDVKVGDHCGIKVSPTSMRKC
jgi:D-arabinose 1-dehydrogenase-like Zn-dependent alcohol dehydrogenase